MKNKAVDFIVEHLGTILAVYHENDSHEIAWLNLTKVALPEITGVMDFKTYKIYSEIIHGLNDKIPFLYVMDRLEELEHVKKELHELQLINKKINKEKAQQETIKTNEQGIDMLPPVNNEPT